jgi:ribosomal protein S18 acetylase RimI-like enzyme
MPKAEIEVRRATERDIEPVARIHVEAWRSAYRGLMPDAVIEARSIEQRKQHWTQVISQPSHDLLVAVRADTVLGFCSLIPSRDAGATQATGEIAALYVAPEHWRTGAGRQLMLAGRQAARERGYRELMLWVLSSNTRARAFYESMGLVSDGAEKLEQSRGHALHELRYRCSLDAR